jgi:hypothetical protein
VTSLNLAQRGWSMLGKVWGLATAARPARPIIGVLRPCCPPGTEFRTAGVSYPRKSGRAGQEARWH